MSWWKDTRPAPGPGRSGSPGAARLAQMDADGLNQAEMGALLGVKRAAVGWYFKRAGVAYQRKPSARELRTQALTAETLREWYWQRGLSLRAIAQRAGVSYATVLARMRALGIARRPRRGDGRNGAGTAA